MPLVSIIIPAYNAQRTIRETIQSIQNQTIDDFEIIVINNSSTDTTLAILESIDEPRLRIFSRENNGPYVAQNLGIQKALGEYISFLDADDLWASDKLERQLLALQSHSRAKVAYSWTRLIDENGRFLNKLTPVRFQGNVYKQILLGNFVASGSNILVHRDVFADVGVYDTTFYSSDWDFYIRLAAKYEFALVPDWQILYRQSVNSLSSKISKMEASSLQIVEKAFTAAPTEYQYLKKQSLANVYQYCANKYLKVGQTRADVYEAMARLWKAFRMHPMTIFNAYTQGLLRGTLKKWISLHIQLRPAVR
jgi:glycosyltransferase involved in cell wall biosynthesis